jgi:hypothetical protein
LPWPRAEVALDVVLQQLELELVDVDRHRPRLDLRQVEDVVDQRQQVGAGAVDRARELDLLGVEVALRVVREQPGQDEQAVERRAQLVRHVGQELGLVLRGQRELLRPLLELAFACSISTLGSCARPRSAFCFSC